MDLGEQLAFNADLRSQLADFCGNGQLGPKCTHSSTYTQSARGFPTRDEAVRVNPPSRRRLKPAALAAAGLLVTAGITLASLRRRGIV